MAEFPFGDSFGFDDDGLAQPQPSEAIPESQTILEGLLTELPQQARTLVRKVEQEIAKIQESTELEVADIRERAEQQVQAVENKAENRRKALLQHAVEQLEPLQKDSFRAGELAPALATFVQIQKLKSRLQNVLADPGYLMQYEQIGKTYYFRVIGTNDGAVWGTDVYTSDSQLSTAAVHAGAVEVGEEAVVRVSVVDMSGMPVRGSIRHGVQTEDWGPYAVGYRVARA